MTFAELEIGAYYFDSPGYLQKQKIGAASFMLVDHVDKQVLTEPNQDRPVREVQFRPAWPPTKKTERVYWSED